jgi:hypothetical protein
MAKGQMRSSREQKKPKQSKKVVPGPASSTGTPAKVAVPTSGKKK